MNLSRMARCLAALGAEQPVYRFGMPDQKGVRPLIREDRRVKAADGAFTEVAALKDLFREEFCTRRADINEWLKAADKHETVHRFPLGHRGTLLVKVEGGKETMILTLLRVSDYTVEH